MFKASLLSSKKNLIWLCFLFAFGGCKESVSYLDRKERASHDVQLAAKEASSGRVREAIALYKKILGKDPSMAAVHLDLAMLLHDNSFDYLEAIEHYRSYLKLRPGSDKERIINDRINDCILRLAFSIRESNREDLKSSLDSLLRENELLREENRRLRSSLQSFQTSSISNFKTKEASLPDPEKEVQYLPQNSAESNDKGERRHDVSGRRYTVKSGDTLRSIAKEFYGDPSEWKKIYEANKEIFSGSGVLRVGQVLDIP